MPSRDQLKEREPGIPPRRGAIPFLGLPDGGGSRSGLAIAVAGVPWDGGSCRRPGARHGPGAIRAASRHVRIDDGANGEAPWPIARCADIGDAPVNPIDRQDTMGRIAGFFSRIAAAGVLPVAVGGDQLVTVPVLRAVAGARGPVGLVHFDARTDTADGGALTSETALRRAVEEGLIDLSRTVQVGLRAGAGATGGDGRPPHAHAITVDAVDDRGIEATVADIRAIVGTGPVHLSFDIGCLDPVFAPGTARPEIGGLSTHHARRLVRGLSGLRIASADLVEVAPAFDHAGLTALAGASFLFEIVRLAADGLAARPG